MVLRIPKDKDTELVTMPASRVWQDSGTGSMDPGESDPRKAYQQVLPSAALPPATSLLSLWEWYPKPTPLTLGHSCCDLSGPASPES